MNLFTKKSIALLLFLIGGLNSTASADNRFSSGVTLRYSQLTTATDTSALIGIGYSIKWGSVDYAIELGAPRSAFSLFGDDTEIGEVDLYTANSIGWQLPVASKVSLRTDLSLQNYFITRATNGAVFTIIESDLIYALEPRLSLLFNITSDIDFSVYGGYMLGSESISEPTAGAYLRILWL
jgi:hypothetical protein